MKEYISRDDANAPFPPYTVLDGWNQVEKPLFVGKQVEKQVDKTALSVNKFTEKRFNFLFVAWTMVY